jgi:citrate lyase subunit beta / citryl-CoA lyase
MVKNKMVRSALYVPAHRFSHVVDRVIDRPDALIVDLEDTVPEEQKPEARSQLLFVASQVRNTSDLFALRINALDSGFLVDDFEAVVHAAPDAVVLPKADPTTVAKLAGFLDRNDLQSAIWPMLESSEAVANTAGIIQGSARVTTVLVGAVDLAKSLNVALDNLDASLYDQRSLVAATAHRCGVAALDGIFIGSEDDLDRSLLESRRIGFCGRSLARPSQVGPSNRIFSSQ